MTDRSPGPSANGVELRSDTFTRPSTGMRQAMADAEVGDDVWNEDPTVHRLEARAAEITGKDAAVFVTSGTQGNLVGLLSHTRPGDEVIVGDRTHLFNYETGGAAVVGGLQCWALPTRPDGSVEPNVIRTAIRTGDIHEPNTGCIVIENTHNRCGGAVVPPAYIEEVAGIAREHKIPLHIDGARIFNASVALGVPVSALAGPADSITFCLSKALGAPVGSLLCGTAAYIERARKWRKMLGGGLRQAGILAAAGLYALDHNVERLAEDHANARVLAERLAETPGIAIDVSTVQSNIVNFDVAGTGMTSAEFSSALEALGVRVAGEGTSIRAVTSLEVDRAGIEYALQAIGRLVRRSVPVAV